MRHTPPRLFRPLLAVALDLPLKVLRQLIYGRANLGRRLARTQRRALGEDRSLGDLTRLRSKGSSPPRAPAPPVSAPRAACRASRTSSPRTPQRRSDLDVLALHLKSHASSLGGRQAAVSELNDRPRGASDVAARPAVRLVPDAWHASRPRPARDARPQMPSRRLSEPRARTSTRAPHGRRRRAAPTQQRQPLRLSCRRRRRARPTASRPATAARSDEGAAHVPAALDAREPRLSHDRARALEQWRGLELPASGELRASSAAGCLPRFRLRSPSGGIYVMTSAAGRGTTSATSSAASAASGWRPRSFHARTSRRAAPSYATAARADANASRRPAHSTQRSTGHAVGAPQRAQSGREDECQRRAARIAEKSARCPGRGRRRQPAGGPRFASPWKRN